MPIPRDPAMQPAPPHAVPDPAEQFASVISLRRHASQLERDAVDRALEAQWTWAQIGQALGMTAQAAHKRLAPSRRSELR